MKKFVLLHFINVQGFIFACLSLHLPYYSASTLQPLFRIQLCCFLTQLKVENRISFFVGMHLTQYIPCTDTTTFLHPHRRQITINRDVTSMTHQHIGQSVVLKNCRNFTIKYGTGICPCFPFISMPLLSSLTLRSPCT